jgi:O-antigen ligase
MSYYGLKPIHQIIRREWFIELILGIAAIGAGWLIGYVATSTRLLPDLDLQIWQYFLLIPVFAASLALAAAIIRWPAVGAVLLAAVVYGNLSEIGVRYHSLPSVSQGLLALLLVALSLRLIFDGIGYLRLDPLLIVMVLFAGLVFASSIYAPDTSLADERFSQHARGFVVLFVLFNMIRTRKDLHAAVWALIIVAGIISGIAVLQVATSSYDTTFGGLARVKNAQIVEGIFEPRIAGTVSDPNFFAQILLIAIPLALYRFWDSTKLIGKMLAAGAFVLINIAVVFTFSRGAMIAAAVVYLFAAIHRRLSFQFLITIAIAAIGLWAILPPEASKRINTLTQLLPGSEQSEVKIDTSFQERTLLMNTAAEMFRDNMILGVGAGNYTKKFDEYAQRVGSNVSSYEGFDKKRFPHSLYLETGAELGLVGLLLLIMIGFVAIYYAFTSWRLFQGIGDFQSSQTAFAIGLSILSYGLTSLFLHGAYVQYVWLLTALALVCRKVALTERPPLSALTT